MKRFILDGGYEQLLAAHGIEAREALLKAGQPEDTLRQRTPTMSADGYFAFMQAIGELAPREDTSILMASTEGIEQFSPPIFASFCSSDGRSFIERLTKYKPLIGPMEFLLVEENEALSVELSCPETQTPIPSFLVECEIAFLVNMLRTATKEMISPTKVVMQTPPEGQWFVEFLGREVEEGQRNVVSFSTEDLALPFITRNDSMWDYFEPELGRRLSELDVDETLAARVRSALIEALPAGEVAADEIAQRLGVSKRTLQRKLGDEGTTYQKQLNHVRELLAKRYLTTTSMRTDEIAFMLGYVELNSFLRAFSSWTGSTPSEYRKQQQR